jgi:AcrR family transcriptional regulator
MSRNAKESPSKIDRRVRRTRDALGDALVGLMHEKPFDAITVQNVLERAGVGRSTFYAHYRDKDDLFLSDVEDFFELMAGLLERRGEVSKRVAPVREMFAHLAEAREFYAALIASGKIQDVLEIGQGYFMRAIESRLGKVQLELTPLERTALAQMFAGALIASLSWWVQRGMPVPAEEMDELYHRMVWRGISGPGVPRSATVFRSATGD